MLSFRKNLMSQSQENVHTDGRTDGRRDRQILFYRTLPAETDGPTTSFQQVTWGNSEYTLSCFKKNAKIFSKNSTTQ